jgi:hypothetical protein
METKKKFNGSGRFDSVNSTFKHVIHLQNGYQLVGYSKGLLTAEASDKVVLLERIIIRLYNNDYFNPTRTKCIEYFLNDPLSKEKQHVITLYPDRYDIGKIERYTTDIRLKTFLERFYTQIRNGVIITKSLQHKVQSNNTGMYDYKAKKFRDKESLHDFIIKEIQRGIESSQVMHYYTQYVNYHF